MDSQSDLLDATEIQKLPRFARVALAARYSRRCEPIFRLSYPDAPPEEANALTAAVSLTEATATLGASESFPEKAYAHIEAVSEFATSATDYFSSDLGTVQQGAHASAFRAITAGILAANYALKGRLDPVQRTYSVLGKGEIDELAAIVSLGSDASTVAEQRPSGKRSDMARANRLDFLLLVALAAVEGWTDETPVDPNRLGPLWPERVPQWWSESSSRSDSPGYAIEFEIPDGLSEKEVTDRISAYLLDLNAMHRTLGGKGLKIVPPIEVIEPALACEGAGT